MKIVLFLVPALLITIIPAYADFHEEMVKFMPSVDNFDENWDFTQIQGFKDLELDWSTEKPDGLIQRFVFTDEIDQTKMINTVSIYDFTTSDVSSGIYEEYVSTLLENDYPVAPIDRSLQKDCFATMINQGQDNEKTSITCKNSKYIIIS
ncbi:MAG: hypothetical protein R3327_08480, partial [Nitrosopumilaceae archaeon]|nr:hypothetical protein [Nitrosopumilaceae archaeon]